ncbi:MAG: sulfatase, partial [Planctomycetes bacterium]|nr:sulfatase [Planctomycetota bacterium]
MDLVRENQLLQTRRHFFGRTATGIGAAALASLTNPNLFAAGSASAALKNHGLLGATHFAPKAKRVIYLFMSGAPSQIDL